MKLAALASGAPLARHLFAFTHEQGMTIHDRERREPYSANEVSLPRAEGAPDPSYGRGRDQ